MGVSLFSNILWALNLAFKNIPLPAFARLVADIYDFVSSLLRAFIVGVVIDWLIAYASNTEANSQYVTYSLMLFGGYYLLNSLMGIVRNWGHNLINFHLEYIIPEKLLQNKLNDLTVSDLENHHVQNLITRYRDNSYTIDVIITSLFEIIGATIALAVAIIPLMHTIPTVAVLLILSTIPAIWFNKMIINGLWKVDKKHTTDSRRASTITSMLGEPKQMKEIKLIGGFHYLQKYFLDYANAKYTDKKSWYIKWAITDLISAVLTVVAIILGIYQIIQLVGNGSISPGQVVFYLSTLTAVGGYLDSLSSRLTDFLGLGDKMNEMRELLRYESKNHQGLKINDVKKPPHITFSNVSFAYPGSDKKVIKNLNLEIKPGEKIAIVGENGAGKTTLAKLISGIYKVNDGKVTAGKYDLSKVNEDSWFKNIGILYQDYNTYDCLTAFENIALGKMTDEIDYEQIKEAAKKADAHEFIMDYKNNYSQVLSERYEDGIRPSTGQWQKIAIARFFYRNAPILILDEPTASIDAVAEANIFNRIYEFMSGKTVIIISHRFSTVRNADRIIVFDKGKIVEEGNHKELLALNGKYAKAFRLQAKGYDN